MSYNIYLYDKSAKEKAAGGDIEEIEFPAIPAPVIKNFKERLLEYDYALAHEDEKRAEYRHEDEEWGITVNIFDTQIAFSVPYWDDAGDAIFEALMTATELCDDGELIIYNPQDGQWTD